MAGDRVAQAPTIVVGGRSVHVVKAKLPICEQKIYVWSWSKSENGWSVLETTLMTHNGPISLTVQRCLHSLRDRALRTACTVPVGSFSRWRIAVSASSASRNIITAWR